MCYYFVIAKCGHVGKGKYIDVIFPIMAETKKEASQMVLLKPKVKKQLSNAISSVFEVSKEEFDKQININKDDIYIHSHCKKEIKKILNSDKIQILPKKKQYKNSFEFNSKIDKVNYYNKKEKIKNMYMD